MKVFKFGGASISTAERIRNAGKILDRYHSDQLVVVISAMGKTTNALEQVVEAFFAGNTEQALALFKTIKSDHISLFKELDDNGKVNDEVLNDFFTEVEWLLHDKPVQSYDYYYDQIVCIGEILSSFIVSHYLNQNGVKNKWIDVRDIIRTDDNFRDAKIDWTITSSKVNETIKPLFQQTDIIITQGFIGATDENESTTLGREGSDYTAAVFANLLDAECQTIWKDVKGVMNADPKQYDKAEWIKELNYREVIEMAYYGAQVIHPKTIKPLQNKGIPLFVRSFIDHESEGTIIHDKKIETLPPIIVYKHDQVLLQLNSKDFSFVGEGLTAELYRIFEKLKFRPNLTQNAAISLLCVVDNNSQKIEAFSHAASSYFDVTVRKDLTLLTIRHCDDDLLSTLSKGRKIFLKQETPETVQVLLEN